jgi:cbb3-type cytochrome oxidase maturation protein
MSALYILVIVSICVAGLFLAAFIWCVKSNQYEDQKGSSMRILYDDDLEREIFK